MSVRMRLPVESSWSPGVCSGLVGPRSYKVKVGGNVYIRNRQQTILVNKPLPQDLPDIDEPSTTMSGRSNGPPELPLIANSSHEPSSDIECTAASPSISPQLQRSKRSRRPPDWITNYVPS